MDRKNEYLPNSNWPGLPETSCKYFLIQPCSVLEVLKLTSSGLDLIFNALTKVENNDVTTTAPRHFSLITFCKSLYDLNKL